MQAASGPKFQEPCDRHAPPPVAYSARATALGDTRAAVKYRARYMFCYLRGFVVLQNLQLSIHGTGVASLFFGRWGPGACPNCNALFA